MMMMMMMMIKPIKSQVTYLELVAFGKVTFGSS